MNNTADLIAALSAEAKASKPLPAPMTLGLSVLAVLAIYAVATQLYLGLRPDLSMQLTRPFFVAEILLLTALAISSAIAAVLAMYPDVYQKPQLLKLPYAIFSALVGLILFQLFMPHDARMVMPEGEDVHAMECAICIASVALIPAALLFALLKKGASIRPLQAGSFAVLAASAVGCLTLRLAEENDSLMHLVSWHYVPTLLFAMLGAAIGKKLLRW